MSRHMNRKSHLLSHRLLESCYYVKNETRNRSQRQQLTRFTLEPFGLQKVLGFLIPSLKTTMIFKLSKLRHLVLQNKPTGLVMMQNVVECLAASRNR